MKRIGLSGVVAAFALAAVSCGDSESKPLVAEVRYGLVPHPGAAGCAPPNPSFAYVVADGRPAVDGGTPLDVSCNATKLADGTLQFQVSSATHENGRTNGISVRQLRIDPKTCDATTHECTVVPSACDVTIYEDDGRIATFEGDCTSNTPAQGSCQVTQVTLDRANPDGKTFSFRLYCDRIAASSASRSCDLVDPAMATSPAYLRFSGCQY